MASEHCIIFSLHRGMRRWRHESPDTTAGASAAITDLYDEQTNSFLVQYPALFIIGMALAGLVIIVITGFWGYQSSNGSYQTGVDWLFQQPWLLFLWLSALTITLIWSVLRDPTLIRQRIQVIVVALLSALIVMLAIFFYDAWDAILQALKHILDFIPNIEINSGLSLGLINYGILLAYWATAYVAGRGARKVSLWPRRSTCIILLTPILILKARG